MNPKIMIGYNFLIKKSTSIPALKIPYENITHQDLHEIFNFAKSNTSGNINLSEKLSNFGIKDPFDARKIILRIMKENKIKSFSDFEKILNETIENGEISNKNIKNIKNIKNKSNLPLTQLEYGWKNSNSGNFNFETFMKLPKAKSEVKNPTTTESPKVESKVEPITKFEWKNPKNNNWEPFTNRRNPENSTGPSTYDIVKQIFKHPINKIRERIVRKEYGREYEMLEGHYLFPKHYSTLYAGNKDLKIDHSNYAILHSYAKGEIDRLPEHLSNFSKLPKETLKKRLDLIAEKNDFKNSEEMVKDIENKLKGKYSEPNTKYYEENKKKIKENEKKEQDKSLLENPLVTGGIGFGTGLLLSKSLFSNQNSKED